MFQHWLHTLEPHFAGQQITDPTPCSLQAPAHCKIWLLASPRKSTTDRWRLHGIDSFATGARIQTRVCILLCLVSSLKLARFACYCACSSTRTSCLGRHEGPHCEIFDPQLAARTNLAKLLLVWHNALVVITCNSTPQ